LIIAGMATVYGYGPNNSKLSAGSFVVIQMYIDQLFQPLAQLGWQYRMITQAFTDLEKAVTMLNRQSEVQDARTPLEWTKSTNDKTGELIFSNVSFQYKIGSQHRTLGQLWNVETGEAIGETITPECRVCDLERESRS
jgi:ABC-type transport system involved in Fe-S cluster assembly fused permease/ATPase subunit